MKPIILEFMTQEERPLSEKEIRLGIPRRGIVVSMALRALMKANEVERTGKVRYFRYQLAGRIFESHPEELEERHLFNAKER